MHRELNDCVNQAEICGLDAAMFYLIGIYEAWRWEFHFYAESVGLPFDIYR